MYLESVFILSVNEHFSSYFEFIFVANSHFLSFRAYFLVLFELCFQKKDVFNLFFSFSCDVVSELFYRKQMMFFENLSFYQ